MEDKQNSHLSNRVGQLFMLDNDFFSSSFMREKIPSLLFKNGHAGLEFPRRSASSVPFERFSHLPLPHQTSVQTEGSGVRNVPIKVKNPEPIIQKSSSPFEEISSVRNSTPVFDKPFSSSFNSNHAQSSININHVEPSSSYPNTSFSLHKPENNRGNEQSYRSETMPRKTTLSTSTWYPKTETTTSINGRISPHRAADLPPLSKAKSTFTLKIDKPSVPLPTLSGPAPSSTSKATEFRFQPSSSILSLPSLQREFRSQSQYLTPHKQDERDYDYQPPKKEYQRTSSSLINKTSSIPDLIHKSFTLPRGQTPDPVEEAIRSLEAFDPSDLVNSNLVRSQSVSSPNLDKTPTSSRPMSPINYSTTTLISRPVSPSRNPSHLTDLLTLQCKKIAQMASKHGWRSYGELEAKLPEIKDSFQTIFSSLQQLCRLGIDNVRVEDRLKDVVHDLRRMNIRVDEWTSRMLWRGAWSDGRKDDLDEFVDICHQLLDDLKQVQSSSQQKYSVPHNNYQLSYSTSTSDIRHAIDRHHNDIPSYSTTNLNYQPSNSVNNNYHNGHSNYNGNSYSTANLDYPHGAHNYSSNNISDSDYFQPQIPRQPYSSSTLDYNNTKPKHNYSTSTLNYSPKQTTQPVSPIQQRPYYSMTDIMDGGESTTSSTNSSPTINGNNIGSRDTLTMDVRRSASPVESEIIMEEDDLASVISEAVDNSWEEKKTIRSPAQYSPKEFEDKFAKRLKDPNKPSISLEDMELIEFCAPQIRDSTKKLTKLIQEFFNVIETSKQPEKFVQKVKMIVLVGKVLGQLASNTGNSLQSVPHKEEFLETGEMLNNTVNYCEETVQVARKQYPSVSATESLVAAVNSLSQQAQNLNIIIALTTFKQ